MIRRTINDSGTETRDHEQKQTRANARKPRPNDDGTWRYILSDESVDSHRSIIRVKGWQLKRFRANPVVPWAHAYHIPPVGRSEKTYKDAVNGMPLLVMHVRFATPEDYGNDWPDAYPSPQQIEAMTASGYIRGASVGMDPIEWDWRRAVGKDGDQGEVIGIEYRKQELLEGSIVPIPSNANALVRSLHEGHLTMLQLPAVLSACDLSSEADPEMIRVARAELSQPRQFFMPANLTREPEADIFDGEADELLEDFRAVGDLAAGMTGVPNRAPHDGSDVIELLLGPATDLEMILARAGRDEEIQSNERTTAPDAASRCESPEDHPDRSEPGR